MKIFLFFILLISIYFLPASYMTMKTYIISGLLIIWIGYVIAFIAHRQKLRFQNPKHHERYNKKHIPNILSVFELGYLLNGKIISSMFGISVAELVRKRIFLLRYNPQKEDYVFVNNSNYSEEITEPEHYLINWLINNIGNGEKVSLSLIKSDALHNSAYFVNCYNDWRNMAAIEGAKLKFFENKNRIIDRTIGMVISSIAVALLGLFIGLPTYLNVSSLVATLILIIYVDSFCQRTEEGNLEHSHWIAFSHSIKKGDACNDISDPLLIERVTIYARLLNTNSKKMLKKLSRKRKNSLEDTEFITYNKTGIISEICSKMNTLVTMALIIGGIFTKNRGSRAVPKCNKQ